MISLFLPITVCMALTSLDVTTSINEDVSLLEQLVHQYAAAGDKQDIKMLKPLLQHSFRIVFNDTKEQEVKILDKNTYLDLLTKKVFGGDKRTVEISSLDVYDGKTAVIKVRLLGEKASMFNYLSFVKETEGWKIVEDLVFM